MSNKMLVLTGGAHSACVNGYYVKKTLTVMHLNGDMRLFLTEAQWTVVTDTTALLKI
jgi:hypothetical protein